MTRGKEAAAAAARRLHDAEQRIHDLECALAETKAAARSRELELEEKLRVQGYEVMHRTSEQVQELMSGAMERVADGLSNAVWRAQRVAMTEHLTWLFFKGYLKWDRFDGDYEMLHFLLNHGDLKAWFILTSKYGHHDNYKTRRYQAKKADPVNQMLRILRDIDRAKDGDRKEEADRKRLDEVVDYARDAFTNVELREMLTTEGWVSRTPTEDEVAMHKEILDSLPEFHAAAAVADAK